MVIDYLINIELNYSNRDLAFYIVLKIHICMQSELKQANIWVNNLWCEFRDRK